MIKNKDKQELLDFTYQLLAENKVLLEELEKYKNNPVRKIIKTIFYPIAWIFYIRQYNNKLNTMRNLTKQELVDVFNAINKYENKQLSSLVYKDLFLSTTSINLCGNCGIGMDRIHNDFQRTILSQFKTNYPELLPSILFYSGKYSSSDFYMNSIPYNTYDANEVVLAKMKNEHKQLKNKGYVEQSSLLETDIKALSKYIEDRRTNLLSLDVQTVKEFDDLLSPKAFDKLVEKVSIVEDVVNQVVEVLEDKKVSTNEVENVESFSDDEKSVYNLIKETPKKVSTFEEPFDEGQPLGLVNTVFSENKAKDNTPAVDLKPVLSPEKAEDDLVLEMYNKVPEKAVFDVNKALIMKEQGKSNTEIGAHFGMTYQAVSKAFRNHKED